MSLVLDASATLAWLYPEELTGAITAAFEMIADDCAWVPSLWRIEVANSLSVSLRRGNITPLRRRESLVDLQLLPSSAIRRPMTTSGAKRWNWPTATT
jgi:predicted nucleic acid-binding protein